MLSEAAQRLDIDLCLLSEPNKAIARRSNDWRTDDEADTATWWTGRNRVLAVRGSGAGNGFTWIDIVGVAVIYSCYFSPNKGNEEFGRFLDELAGSIETQRGGFSKVIITGDFNAAASEWGSVETSARGRRLQRWLAEKQVMVVNDGQIATFARGDQRSFIDLTIAGRESFPRVEEWRVAADEVSRSDHRYVIFRVRLDEQAADEPPPPKKRWQWRMLNKAKLIAAIDRQCQDLEADGADEHRIRAILVKACEEAAPRTQHYARGRARQPVYWWNNDIAQARAKCVRLRRACTRARSWLRRTGRTLEGAAATRAQRQEEELKSAYRQLCTLIKRSKASKWKELIERVERDKFGLPYQIVTDKLRKRAPRLPAEQIREAVDHLFPSQPPRVETPIVVNQEDIPEITTEEIEQARERLAAGKAPGPDGLPPEAIKLLIKRWPDLFRSLANRLLREGRFPKIWKEADLVLIPKPGKKTGPSAQRPICLLNTTAKVMENVIIARLEKEIEEKSALSDSQYGFRKGKSTLAAIQRVLHTAQQERKETDWKRKFVLMVLLDVRNAFNTANWGVIMAALEKKEISPYLRRIISSYLDDRDLYTGHERRQISAGVPQGSVLGPTLWNLAYDEVIEMREMPDGAECIAYADDLAVLVTAKTEASLQDTANAALDEVEDWMKRHHLTIAPEKSEAIYLTGRKATEGVHVRIGGTPIKINKKAKYLGVILDKGLTGTAHTEYAAGKAARCAANLARLMPRVNGPSEETRRLLATVAESVALYASPIWADVALDKAKNRKTLLSAQRTVAIRVARAYRTVATSAVLVLAKMIPWDLLADERAERYLDGDLDLTTARKATLVKWQQQWEQIRPGDRGYWTRSLIPNIGKWYDRPHGELSYGATQVLSGHGQFQTYMCKIGKAQEPACILCDSGVADDPEHTIFTCEALLEARLEASRENPAHWVTIKSIVEDMVESQEKWIAGTTFFERLMRRKEELERDRRRRLDERQRSGPENRA